MMKTLTDISHMPFWIFSSHSSGMNLLILTLVTTSSWTVWDRCHLQHLTWACFKYLSCLLLDSLMLYHGRVMKTPLVSVYMESGAIGKLSSLSLHLINWRSEPKDTCFLFPLLSGWFWCSFQEAAHKILQNHASVTHSEANSRAHPHFGFLHFLI